MWWPAVVGAEWEMDPFPTQPRQRPHLVGISTESSTMHGSTNIRLSLRYVFITVTVRIRNGFLVVTVYHGLSVFFVISKNYRLDSNFVSHTESSWDHILENPCARPLVCYRQFIAFWPVKNLVELAYDPNSVPGAARGRYLLCFVRQSAVAVSVLSDSLPASCMKILWTTN
jgi:hypothetical protein